MGLRRRWQLAEHQAALDLRRAVRTLAGPSQRGEVVRTADLIEGLACGHLIAERACHAALLAAAAQPVIPPRLGRRRPHAYDRHLRQERNPVERGSDRYILTTP